jgi:predicted flavoprotein YhiN
MVFSEDMRQRYSCLSGVSLVAAVRCRRQDFRGSVLFTHRGLSGPAILQISLVWLPGDEILIDLFPDADAHALLREHRHTKTALPNLLARFLPKRFAAVWCAEQALSRPLNSYRTRSLPESPDCCMPGRLVLPALRGSKRQGDHRRCRYG